MKKFTVAVLSVFIFFSLIAGINASAQTLLPAGCTTSTGYSSATGESCAVTFIFTRNLMVGSTGTDVTALQNFLIGKKYSLPSGATGYFGTQTRSALAAFQNNNGILDLTPGYFGPPTRSRVNAIIAVTPIVAAKPDLIIKNVDFLPTSPRTNEWITTSVKIKNNSNMNINTPFDINVQGTLGRVNSLGAGKETTVTVPNAFSLSFAGTRSLNFIVDALNVIDESNETNNVFPKPITISGAVPTLPSITITSPNGGEKWILGNKYPVAFSQYNLEGLTAKVELERKGQENGTYCLLKYITVGKDINVVDIDLSQGCLNKSEFGEITPGDYKIEIHTGTISAQDYSDNYFAIISTTTPPTTGRVDLTVNGLEKPSQVTYGSIMEIAWGTTGLNINNTSCSISGHYIPRVDGGVSTDMHNLPANGFVKLYAKHQNFGYVSPLDLVIQCFDGVKDYKDEVFIPVIPPPTITSLSQTSGPAGTMVTITGTGFTTINNRVLFGNGLANGLINGSAYYNIVSSDNSHITFYVPPIQVTECVTPLPTCTYVTSTTNQPGTYPVSVKTNLGTSNSVNFTLTSPIAPTYSPTASLTLNGSHNLTVKAGEPLTYAWNSTNGRSYSTVIVPNGSGCGYQDISFVATSSNGSVTQAAPARAGCSYTITYTVSPVSIGYSPATDSATLTIISATPETVACTQEVKLCSDGSYVGRRAPTCEFATCPTVVPPVVVTSPTASILVNGKSETTIFTDVTPVTAKLSWSSTNATSCLFEKRVLAKSGSVEITVYKTTTYNLSCTGSGGVVASSSAKVIIQSASSPQPVVSPSYIETSSNPQGKSQSFGLASIQAALNKLVDVLKGLIGR